MEATKVLIPSEYASYKDVFDEPEPEHALPKHQPWDYEIVLELGKSPTFGPIYLLLAAQLKVLWEYIEENLKKGFIWKSTLPAGYPILFAPKKDGKLRLCVDYQQLNSITVKNRYTLPRSTELIDRFQGVKVFSKLDLRSAYNLIYMKEGEE